jgi:hypothetical protein
LVRQDEQPLRFVFFFDEELTEMAIRRTTILSTLILATCATVFAANEADAARARFNSLQNKDTTAGANAIVGMINDAATKAQAATHFMTRRQWEMLINDMQDGLAQITSADALKVFGTCLAKLPPDAQVALCFGLKSAPANAELDTAAVGLLKPGSNFRVHVAAMEMLAAHKHQPAVEKIIALLDAKAFPSVQIAACRALALIPAKESIPALIKYITALQGGGGRYVYEATSALRALTGLKLQANIPELKSWWEKNEKDLNFDLSKVQPPVPNYELTEKQEVEYYEIPCIEHRIVIVLDCSGSMQLGGNPNRMDKAKEALKLFISRLRDKQLFNIVTFSNAPRRWKQQPPLVPANDANRKEATAYVDSLKFGGGTNTTTTMEETLREVAVTYGCETIYLVTDGNPNPWSQEITNAQQERHISFINQALKVRINTVGIYTKVDSDSKFNVVEDKDKMKEFLQKLAEHNDGTYKEVQ